MATLRAVRYIERYLGLFPESHAVMAVYISPCLGIKICRWFQRHLSAAQCFDGANISIISETTKFFGTFFNPCLRRPFAIRGSNVEIAVVAVEDPSVVDVVPLRPPTVRAGRSRIVTLL